MAFQLRHYSVPYGVVSNHCCTFDLADLRMLTKRVQLLETERAIFLLCQTSRCRLCPNCGRHLKTVAKAHGNAPRRSLKMRPPRKLHQYPIPRHFFDSFAIFLCCQLQPSFSSGLFQAKHQRFLPFNASLNDEARASLTTCCFVDELFQGVRQQCVQLSRFRIQLFEPRGEQRMLKNCAAGYSRELPLLSPSGHPNRQVDILPGVRVVVVFLLPPPSLRATRQGTR